MNEKISVIIPVYGVEAYLARAVDSVLAQTYANLQIILVDDGSPDNCAAICDCYARQDERVTVIHKQNGGLSSARNAGIQQATGAYLAFLDADDYYCPTMLERLYYAIVSNDCKIAQCGYYRFTQVPEKQTESPVVLIQSYTEALRRIDEAAYMAVWNKLYKAELFAQIRFPEGKIHEDVGTTYRLFYESPQIAVIPDTLYGYFENPNSITTSKIKNNKLDILDMYIGQIEFFREKGMITNMRRAANNLAACFGTLLSYDALRYADYDEFHRRIREKFSIIRKTHLRGVRLRTDLRLAVMLSCGNVDVMWLYHQLKQRIRH